MNGSICIIAQGSEAAVITGADSFHMADFV